MIIRKLKYGLNKLLNELRGKEDYWNPRLKPMTRRPINPKIYFHDMLPKGMFIGEFKGCVPIIYLNGNQPVIFHITVFNYSLGLLNRLDKHENVSKEIKDILQWTLTNQQKDGSWRYNYPPETKHPLANNKASGMTQGLAVSFIIRAYRCDFLSKEECMDSVEKAIKFMLSDEIVANYKGHKLIEEFYTPGHGILNGAIFALYGLYDYCYEIDNFDMFQEYISDLKELMNDYKLFGWSYYHLKGMIASKFYHQLHIDMMHVLYMLTDDNLFNQYARYWERGKRFSVFFILLKSGQKLLNIRSMPLTNIQKS